MWTVRKAIATRDEDGAVGNAARLSHSEPRALDGRNHPWTHTNVPSLSGDEKGLGVGYRGGAIQEKQIFSAQALKAEEDGQKLSTCAVLPAPNGIVRPLTLKAESLI